MSLTVQKRDPLQGVGTLNASAPGNLGTVTTGNFYKRPGGPRLTGDTSANSYGWSADLHTVAGSDVQRSHTFQIAGTAAASGWMISAFHYFASVANNGSNTCVLESSYQSNGNPNVYVCLDSSTGHLVYLLGTNYQFVDTGIAYPLNKFFELRHTCAVVSGNQCKYTLNFRLAGSAAWTTLFSGTVNFASAMDNWKGGMINPGGGGSGSYTGRYGMPGLYVSSDYANDCTALISDVVDPSNGPFNWYCNPATGDDNNDGTTAGTAWASIAKINVESANTGMFPATGGYAAGDTLTIDTTATNLVLGTASLNLNTRGLNVVQLGGGRTGTGEVQAWERILAGAWSPASGAVNVYQCTLSSNDPSAVMWEGDLWLNHPTGSNLAAVQVSLVTTPGSFWTDGATMYYHAFGDTDPRADGKVRTRSYNRAGTGASAVQRLAPDIRLSGLRVRKTCLADKSTNDPVAAYCFQSLGKGGGVSLLDGCYGDYGSKHVFGTTDDDLSKQTTYNNCQAEQGSPYASQTPWVDYSSQSGTGNAVTTYNGCVTNKTTGLIGSTAGQNTAGAWLSHNAGATAFQFASIVHNNCTYGGSVDTYGAVTAPQFVGGSNAGGTLRSPNASASRVLLAGVLTSGDASMKVTVRNCIVVPVFINGGFEPTAAGTIDYQACTIDMRVTATNSNNLALFARSAALALTWRNNLFLGHATLDFGVVRGANASEVTFDHNAYVLPSGGHVAFAYNDGSTTSDRTFAQWQAAGKGAGSFLTATPKIGADYQPQQGSPLIDAGADIGPLTDFAGQKVFSPRNDIGAYESIPSSARRGTRGWHYFGYRFGFGFGQGM